MGLFKDLISTKSNYTIMSLFTITFFLFSGITQVYKYVQDLALHVYKSENMSKVNCMATHASALDQSSRYFWSKVQCFIFLNKWHLLNPLTLFKMFLNVNFKICREPDYGTCVSLSTCDSLHNVIFWSNVWPLNMFSTALKCHFFILLLTKGKTGASVLLIQKDFLTSTNQTSK